MSRSFGNSTAERPAPRPTLGELAERVESVDLRGEEIGDFGYRLEGIETSDLGTEGVAALSRTFEMLAGKLDSVDLSAQDIGRLGYGLPLIFAHGSPEVQPHVYRLVRELTTRFLAYDISGRISSLPLLKSLFFQRETFNGEIGIMFDSLDSPSPLRQHEELQLGFREWQLTQQCYGLFGRSIPEWLSSRIDRFSERGQMPVASVFGETPLLARAKRDFPDAHTIFINCFVSGFELDVAVQVDMKDGPKINYEYDGLHHLRPLQQLYDRIRDEHLVSLGWEVQRFAA